VGSVFFAISLFCKLLVFIALIYIIFNSFHELWLKFSRFYSASAFSCNSQSDYVCLSVHPSVTFRCFVQTNEHTIVRSSAPRLTQSTTGSCIMTRVRFVQKQWGGPSSPLLFPFPFPLPLLSLSSSSLPFPFPSRLPPLPPFP